MDWRKLVSYLQVASLWVLIVAIPFRMGPFQYWTMIAAGVLFPVGVLLTPMWASAAMAFSSVSVILNSLRLR